MRPVYENQQTLELERLAISTFADQFDVQPVKLPISYNIDYACLSGELLMFWAEVKNRNYPHNAFETFSISAKKILNGLHLRHLSGKGFYLVVQWTNALGYVQVTREMSQDIRFGGRKDRADWQDQEPMVHIPIDHFEFLN